MAGVCQEAPGSAGGGSVRTSSEDVAGAFGSGVWGKGFSAVAAGLAGALCARLV